MSQVSFLGSESFIVVGSNDSSVCRFRPFHGASPSVHAGNDKCCTSCRQASWGCRREYRYMSVFVTEFYPQYFTPVRPESAGIPCPFQGPQQQLCAARACVHFRTSLQLGSRRRPSIRTNAVCNYSILTEGLVPSRLLLLPPGFSVRFGQRHGCAKPASVFQQDWSKNLENTLTCNCAIMCRHS